MMSLRTRAVAGGVIWASVVSLLGFFFLGGYLTQQTQSRFDDLLKVRHDRAIVALANSDGDPDQMVFQLSDPVYQSPFSGSYWQFQKQGGDEIVVSRSLADALLPILPGINSELALANILGPAGQQLRSTSQMISLGDGSAWNVQVAASIETLVRDQDALKQRLTYAIMIITALAILGALGLVLFTLRPLEQLRKDVASRWTSSGDLSTEEYPSEVQPLVVDINELLTRNREIVGRSRRQTADLAHALKTPSAILRNELEALKENEFEVSDSLDALDRLDAQLTRSFARMRAVQGSFAENSTTDLDLSLGRMSRAFATMAKNKDRTMRTFIAPKLHAKINQNDLEEIVGNLLDNALKWSRSMINLHVEADEKSVKILIEDDGPGISLEDRDRIFSSGERLDETKPGTGLGLSIACELTKAYNGTMHVLVSKSLGGAKFEVVLPLMTNREIRF